MALIFVLFFCAVELTIAGGDLGSLGLENSAREFLSSARLTRRMMHPVIVSVP
jgi:hypothetical protein